MFQNPHHEAIAAIIRETIKPGQPAQQAASSLHASLSNYAKREFAHNPDIELFLRAPTDNHYAGNCWLIGWEAGPHEWGTKASYVACEAGQRIVEPYFSFDLCFYDGQ